MKARKVKVDPDAPFADGLRAVLSVRLDELHSLAAAGEDALHDMRIAAKRVRYVLETAEPVFGPAAKGGAKAMRQIQDVLGEIHDCDELLALLDRHVARLREQDAAAALAGEPLPNRRKYRGLEALRAHTVAERERLHVRFTKRWAKLEPKLATELVSA